MNNYYADLFNDVTNTAMVHSSITVFPLHLYDSTLFDERLIIKNEFPCSGVVLQSSKDDPGTHSLTHLLTHSPNHLLTHPESSPRQRGLGTWVDCIVNGYNSSNNTLEISVKYDDDIDMYKNFTVPRYSLSLTYLLTRLTTYSLTHRIYVSVSYDDIVLYGQRITSALRHRYNCVSLMKYYFYVRNMPFHSSIISSISTNKIEKIIDQAKNMKFLHNLNETIASNETEVPTHSPTHSPTYSLTLTYSLTYSLTPTYSLTHLGGARGVRASNEQVDVRREYHK